MKRFSSIRYKLRESSITRDEASPPFVLALHTNITKAYDIQYPSTTY